jgi:hypothetical protein
MHDRTVLADIYLHRNRSTTFTSLLLPQYHLKVWSNGVKALQSFGLDPMKYSGQMDRMAYLQHDSGETLCDFPLESLYTRVRK